jgi:hypothetical protein
VELAWLGGGDVPPGGTPQLAARLPWLRRTADLDGGGSRKAGSRKAAGGGPSAAAAALWEAAAALAGVEAGRTKLPPRRGLAPLPPAPRLPPFAPRTPQQDDGGGDIGMPAADSAATPDAAAPNATGQVRGCAWCTLHQFVAVNLANLSTLHYLRWQHDGSGPGNAVRLARASGAGSCCRWEPVQRQSPSPQPPTLMRRLLKLRPSSALAR